MILCVRAEIQIVPTEGTLSEPESAKRHIRQVSHPQNPSLGGGSPVHEYFGNDYGLSVVL